MKIKTFENFSNPNDTLLIVDVQKSFRKFFTDMYVNGLSKHCNNFQTVYEIFDNHVEGKNVDKDYLYDNNPQTPINGDLYKFPNIKGRVEKRYNYDVDADFYKKILNDDVYTKIREKEKNKSLKKGESFPTNEGTLIVYIGNNHQWFHVGKKLYELMVSLKGKSVEIVGGSDGECLEDIFVAATSLGVNIKRNWKFIYSASHCPIK